MHWLPENDDHGQTRQKARLNHYVEGQNLTMRMHMRQFTRLTNAFSKKFDNHVAAISLHFMFYKFVRLHLTLRITPAMATGMTERVWEIADIVSLLERREARLLAQARAEASENSLARFGMRSDTPLG